MEDAVSIVNPTTHCKEDNPSGSLNSDYAASNHQLSFRCRSPPACRLGALTLNQPNPLRPKTLKPNDSGATREARAGDGNRTHTTSLEGWSSTIELHPQSPQHVHRKPAGDRFPHSKTTLAGAGFEPAKALPPDLQSGPFGHSGIPPRYLRGNRPSHYQFCKLFF